MKKYTTNDPAFSPEIILPEVTDPGHADIINPAPMQLLQNTLCNKRSIENLQKSMGAVDTGGYNTEIKYHAGEYCMYNNILYKCTGDTQGEWDPGCWVQTNPIEEIKGLQKSIGSLAKLFKTDDEGNMKPLGAAAYAGISKNFDTLEDGFVPDATLMKLLKEQVDEQNSALVDKRVYVIKSSTISFADAMREYETNLGATVFDTVHKNIGNYSNGSCTIVNSFCIIMFKVNASFYTAMAISPVHIIPVYFGFNNATYRVSYQKLIQ